MTFRPRTLVVAGLALASISLAGVGLSSAAFTDSTKNTAKFTVSPDYAAPLVSAATVAMTSGQPGYIRESASYRVYASVQDSGNPASGIDSVRANVSSFDSGQTSVTLSTSGCPCTVGGVTYNYRSGSLTADKNMSDGAKGWTLRVEDDLGNDRTDTLSVIADDTAPEATDIQTVSGGTAGRPTAGDSVVFTTSEALVPGTILSGWTGASTAVRVFIDENSGNDDLDVRTSSGSSTLPLGIVNLGADGYASNDTTFNATMTMSGNQITVVLGSVVGSNNATTQSSSTTMNWDPSSTPTDAADNDMDGDSVNESGSSDREF